MNLSTDPFEDQLRAHLDAAGASAPDPALDTAAVIGEGSRLVRRRRIVAAAGGVAAATVLAIGTYAALTSGAPASVSVPGSSVHTPTLSPSPNEGPISATVTLGMSISGDAIPANPQEYSVTAQLVQGSGTAARAALTLRDSKGGLLDTESTDLDLGSARSALVHFDSVGVVAVLSPGSLWVDLVTPLREGGLTSDDATLGASGWQLTGFRFEKPSVAPQVTGAVRMTPDLAVLDGAGEAVPSGASADGRRVVYWSEALDTFGFVQLVDGDQDFWDRTATWPSEARKTHDRLVLAGAHGSGSAGDVQRGFVVLHVDSMATDVVLSGVPSAANVRTEVIAMGSADANAIVATYETTARPGSYKPSLAWTEASGAAASWTGS